jgi:hypothetical protein
VHGARFGWTGFLLFAFLIASVACGLAAPAPTAMALATSTQAPPTLTVTATRPPTATPNATSTANLAATEKAEARLALLQQYADAGYIGTRAGRFEELSDFHQEWAQLRWYQWWPIHSDGRQYGDLVFHGHFQWATALRTSDLSGCGIVFGVQPNSDHYAVFVDRARIAFFMSRGADVIQVGKTSGSGRLSIKEPAEADVAVIVKGATSTVLVNGEATKYTLSADQSSTGEFAYSLLSGTNKDYGTRCDITDAYLWQPQK